VRIKYSVNGQDNFDDTKGVIRTRKSK